MQVPLRAVSRAEEVEYLNSKSYLFGMGNSVSCLLIFQPGRRWRGEGEAPRDPSIPDGGAGDVPERKRRRRRKYVSRILFLKNYFIIRATLTSSGWSTPGRGGRTGSRRDR